MFHIITISLCSTDTTLTKGLDMNRNKRYSSDQLTNEIRLCIKRMSADFYRVLFATSSGFVSSHISLEKRQEKGNSSVKDRRDFSAVVFWCGSRCPKAFGSNTEVIDCS